MKYKKKVAYLKARIAWWEKQPERYKNACRKPGSVKVR